MDIGPFDQKEYLKKKSGLPFSFRQLKLSFFI